MKSWQLQEAKANLSKVVKEAIIDGPQEISLRGEPTVVVISLKEYRRLLKPKPSFVEFMRKSPLAGVKMILRRDRSLTRKIEL